MTILRYAAATTVAVALILGAMAAALPYSADALDAPRCVFNTIVQPFNNGGTTLSWKVYNAHTITLSGIGEVSDADSIVVYPSEVTEYTLTATGNGGVDTCTVTALPVSAYPNIGLSNTSMVNNQKCEVKVAPDFVVPGGTAVLSWDVGGAKRVEIDHGIGSVSTSGSRVIPNIGVPQTFTVRAFDENDNARTCSATVRPGAPIVPPTFTGGTNLPPAFPPVSQYTQTEFPTFPTVTTPHMTPVVPTPEPQPNPVVVVPAAPAAPQVTATYSAPRPAYVALSSVPYTGTDDTAYTLALLAVALGSFAVLYARRNTIATAMANLVS